MAEIDGKSVLIHVVGYVGVLLAFVLLGGTFGYLQGLSDQKLKGTEWVLGIENVVVSQHGTAWDCNRAKLEWVSKLPEKQRATYMKHLQCEYRGEDK